MKNLKILISIIGFTGLGMTASAQSDLKMDLSHQTGFLVSKYSHIYITDTENRKFVGKWHYAAGNKDFILVLNNVEVSFDKFTREELEGEYTYTIDGKPAALSSTQNKIQGTTEGLPHTAQISIMNAFNHRDNIYTLTYVDANTIKFELNKKGREWGKNRNDLVLPLEITLTRIN